MGDWKSLLYKLSSAYRACAALLVRPLLYERLVCDTVRVRIGVRAPHRRSATLQTLSRQQREKISWVLSISGLEGQEHLLTRQLPGGWKQQVAFGASVIHEPEILFLDEPTSGVDVLARQQFWQLINDFARHGTAILVTTHYMNEAEQCSRMCFMVAGRKVAEGSASEIKAAQPGQLFELKIGELQGSYDRLRQFLEPWRVSIFGDRLHVVLDHPTAELPQVRSYLQSANLSLTDIQPMPFSLEDAFIGEVQRAGGAPP